MAGPSRIDELRKKFDENPRRYFAPLANEYRKIGDFEQAIFICQEFLPQQPGHMSGHIVYGQALFESGRHDEARSVFETALALDPENLIALRHLGDIARALGDNETARAWYRRVLESDPRNEEIAGILTALDAAPPTPPPAATSVENAPIATESAMSSAAPAVEAPQPTRSADPAVTEPLTSAPSESSFDDIAKLFTSPSADASGPLELIHEGEDILPDHEDSSAAKSGQTTASVFDQLPGGPDTSPGGFQAPFIDGLTSSEPPSAPPVSPASASIPAPEARQAPPPNSEAPTPFVTETMAELYVQQGHHEQAIEVYRKLVKLHPNDSALASRLQALESGRGQAERPAAAAAAPDREAIAAAGPTIREFLGLIAEFRPRTPNASNNSAVASSRDSAPAPTVDARPSAAPAERTVGGSLHNLFAEAEQRKPADVSAAPGLAAAPSRDSSQQDGGRGRPTTPAANELSLDHVFRHATPAAGSNSQSSFSFDQFFSQQAQQDVSAPESEPSSEASAGLSDDIQQFNAWLEGLKKT